MLVKYVLYVILFNEKVRYNSKKIVDISINFCVYKYWLN